MSKLKQFVTTWLPPVAGLALIALFATLSLWQLDRAAEKEALLELFDAGTTPRALDPDTTPALYQPLVVEGRYLGERQVLIDNIVRDGRIGWYVVTPFETTYGLLLVNRGWVAKQPGSDALPAIGVGGDTRRIVARAGRLPRVALRPGKALGDDAGWPRIAVYPELADLERALGRELDEPVLLLAEGEPDGFGRDWRPPGRGPSTNYGYAFQWAALALTVAVILVWQLRKRYKHGQ